MLPQGCEQRAAKCIYSGKLQAMLEFLWVKQRPLIGKDKLLLIRDGLLVSMLWQSRFTGLMFGYQLQHIFGRTNA